MIFLIMSAILIYSGLSDWVLVDSSFLTSFTSSNNWEISKSCLVFDNKASFQYNTCQQNAINYAQLRLDNQRIDKKFIQTSYQSEVIVDIFFDDAQNTKISQFTINYTINSQSKEILYQRNYKITDLTQNARKICDSTGTQYFDFLTVVGTSQVQQQEQFNISIGIENINSQQSIGIRNLLVYVKYCLPTCSTCSSSTNCLTCYYGTPQEDGSCACDPSHQFAQTGVGCRQECERDYFIARSDNVCIPDRRIKSFISYFESTTFSDYSPFLFIQDPSQVRKIQSLVQTCSFTSYVGNLLFNEGMSLQFVYSQSLKFIRLRITFYIQDFLNDNRIQILLDDQIQGQIIKTTNDYDYDKVKKLQSSNIICSTYDVIRVEIILRTYSNTPKLMLKGSQLTLKTSIWGFRNVTIDSGNCKENCLVCADFSTCQHCQVGYILFQNGCVSVCPIHSANCVDYADILPYSRYLAKGFYNLNMSTSDINQFFDSTIANGNNFLTGQQFSIFPTKFVLGGVMVWNNAIYKKSWSIFKPHYAVTIRFNLTYGDLYQGNFYYTIQGVKSVAHPKPSLVGYNFIGRSSAEITRYFEIFLNTFQSSSLNIEFQCTDTNADPRNQFCAISDYFIIVHYCGPFCQYCTDGITCVTWESGYTGLNCQSNQFLYFDLTLETYSCIMCNQPGCLTCKNLEECTSCDSLSEYNTLINGVCLQINVPFSQTITCHKYCETCTGTLATNCETCVSEFHRSIFNNQCKCQPGYYDDSINMPCIPICGDFLVVSGEDCDDGNSYPFDGCHNCKYGCDEFCKECLEGNCFDCQNGFQVINNICVSICGDGIVTSNEQCDEGNIILEFGCQNCQFNCQNECLNCLFGQCYECEEIGWEIDLVSKECKSNCGDGIIVGNEQCDDGNDLRYDGCNECFYECQNECTKCINGLCYECINSDWILKNNTCECETCQNLCSNECLSCIKGVCYECQSPNWILDSNNICIQICGEQCSENICGDGILNLQIEECDDGNDQIRDGCDKCLLEKGFLCYYNENLVSQGCTKCQDLNCLKCDLVNESQICSECLTGYFIDEFQYCSQCDLICIECSQNYKNCTTVNPQYSNQQNQQKCNLIQGIYNDLDFYECVSKCGNGILDTHEQCDDNNREILDGCNEFCQLEEGFLYDHITHSLQKEPSIKVEKKQSNNNKYSLLITQYQESLNITTLTVLIEGFSTLDYNYSIIIKNNNQLDLNLTYQKTIEPTNLIHISISYNEQYHKRQLDETINKEIIIVPQRQVYVTEIQRLQGETMAQTYQNIFSAQIYLAPLAIAFGGFKFFLAILDIMSWMNNFYFLNVNYPENVRIIFQQAEWSNIINLPSLHLLNKPTDDYYFYAPIKFVEKEIDPLLFNNVQTPIFFAFQVLITYFLSVMFIKFVKLIYKKQNQKIKTLPNIFQLGTDVKHQECQKDQQLVRNPHLLNDLEIPKPLQSFFNKCLKLKSNLMANLIRSFSLSYLDIALAVMLQITNQQTSYNFIVKINIIAAYGFLILVLYLLYISYYTSQAHQVKLENTLFFSRYCCFYEEMKTESQTAMVYSFLNLIRKTFFIVSTVIFYSYPIFQTLLCFLSCLLNILLLLSGNPYKNKKQYILNLVPDFCIIIIIGCTIIFAFQDRFKILNDESIYQIGWIIGVSIYLSIGLQLIFLIYEILLSFWKDIKLLIAYLKKKYTQK